MYKLVKLYVSNWHSIVNEHIDVKDNIYITGENESGKSMLLDAIRYGFYHDTRFNPAAETKGNERTLSTYTRCLYDTTAKLYARSGVIYSYIFLGWESDNGNPAYTTGCIITTAKDGSTKTSWFYIQTNINNLKFIKEDADGSRRHYSPADFQRVNEARISTEKAIVKYDSWEEARRGIFYAHNLNRISENPEIFSRFSNELKNIVSYSTDKKPTEFISHFVLKDNPADIRNLRETNKKLKEMEERIALLSDERDALQRVMDCFTSYTSAKKKKTMNAYKKLLEEKNRCEADVKQLEEKLAAARITKRDGETGLENIEKTIVNYTREKEELISLCAGSDIFALITTYKNKLSEIDSEIKALEKRKKEVESLQTELMECSSSGVIDWEVVDFTSASMNTADKISEINGLIEQYKSKTKEYIELIYDKEKQKEEINAKIDAISKELSMLSEHRFFCPVESAAKLKAEINKQLEKAGSDERAYFAAELVEEVTDETWRDALETLLGNNRFSIIVNPVAFDLASKVQKSAHLQQAKLVNTKQLRETEINMVSGSVAEYLTTNNETARLYFNHLLGNVVATDEDSVPEYTRAISSNLRYSGGMSITYLAPAKESVLGYEAIKIQIERKFHERSTLVSEKDEVKRKLHELQSKYNLLGRVGEMLTQSYDFSSFAAYRDALISRREIEAKIAECEKQMETDSAYMACQIRKTEVEAKLAEATSKRTALDREIGKITSDIEVLTRSVKEKKQKCEYALGNISSFEAEHPEEAVAAGNEYKLYLSEIAEGKSGKGHGILTDETVDTGLRTAENALYMAENNYCSRFMNFNTGALAYAEIKPYLERYDRINISDMEIAKAKCSELKTELGHIFMSQFVNDVYAKCKAAQKNFNKINSKLHTLKFATKYQFEAKYKKDDSDYQTIIEYACYMERHSEEEYTLMDYISGEDGTKERLFEKIRGVVARLTAENTDNDTLEKLSDYRNYMTYDVKTEVGETGKSGLLSKQAGYNSGAGLQIPYTIILLVSIAMEYGDDSDIETPRLVFMDEPFAKMSSENVKKMFGLINELNLQVIFCGASKIESIGEECDTIIPMLKLNEKQVAIGDIQFKETA